MQISLADGIKNIVIYATVSYHEQGLLSHFADDQSPGAANYNMKSLFQLQRVNI